MSNNNLHKFNSSNKMNFKTLILNDLKTDNLLYDIAVIKYEVKDNE